MPISKTMLAALASLSVAGPAQAALFDRGNGLLYDDELDITWLQDANYARSIGAGYLGFGEFKWADALAWVAALEYGGYTGWRLPTVAPVNGASFQRAFSNNGSTDFGYARTGPDGGWRDAAGHPVSELGHMFYVNLGNAGACMPSDIWPDGCNQPDEYGAVNTSFVDGQTGERVFITGIAEGWYLTGTELSERESWEFSFNFGGSHVSGKQPGWVWPVSDGDIAGASQDAPEPSSLALLAAGLAGLLGMARRQRPSKPAPREAC